MNNKNKRVLWLLNHTTLRECEVPLLRNFGLEVYVPKKFPKNSDNRSASVSYEYDSSLTIPEHVIKKLNQFNFYTDDFTIEIKQYINQYFDICICAFMFPMFDNVIRHFQGKILLRAFGLTSPDWTYFDFSKFITLPGFNKRLAKTSSRFWFANGYEHLSSIEPAQFQRSALYLPLGLPQFVKENADTWSGGQKKILFICPDINTYGENKTAYLQFKKVFGHFPHVICGAQTIPVDDANVVGRLDTESYKEVYKTCAVMFYHSEIPTHIYYHPIEAISYGMPLIYMQKGMLGILAGSKLMGACDSYSEAKIKVARILDGDEDFSDEVKVSQKPILKYFSDSFVKKKWEENFLPLINNLTVHNSNKPLKIAILPTSGNKVADKFVNSFSNIFKGLKFSFTKGVICPLGDRLKRRVCYESKVKIRQFSWGELKQDELAIVQRLSGYAKVSKLNDMFIPLDNRSNFMDCDLWLVIGSELLSPIAPIKPFIFVFTSVPKFSTNKSVEQYQRSVVQDMLNTSQAICITSSEMEQFLLMNFNCRKDKLVKLTIREEGNIFAPQKIQFLESEIDELIRGCNE